MRIATPLAGVIVLLTPIAALAAPKPAGGPDQAKIEELTGAKGNSTRRPASSRCRCRAAI